MTNDEFRRTKEIRSSKSKCRKKSERKKPKFILAALQRRTFSGFDIHS